MSIHDTHDKNLVIYDKTQIFLYIQKNRNGKFANLQMRCHGKLEKHRLFRIFEGTQSKFCYFHAMTNA